MHSFAFVVPLLLAGLIISRVVDLVRTGFDKHDRIPKAYWLLASAVIGIGFAFVVCAAPAVATIFAVVRGKGCPDIVLQGAGFASVAGFWHEVMSALSARSGPAPTPKGLVPGGPPGP